MLPADGSYIEMTSYGETLPEVRVVQATGTVITLSLAKTDLPPANSTVELRWAAAPRGRYAVGANVVAIDGNRVKVQVSGEPAVVQSRLYVRGGGGETIMLVRPGEEDSYGRVHDLSEHAVRANFTDVVINPGEELLLRIQVGDDVVEFPARITKVSSMRQQVPRRGPLSVEMIAVFDTQDDSQARVVRRYIMRSQLAARARDRLA